MWNGDDLLFYFERYLYICSTSTTVVLYRSDRLYWLLKCRHPTWTGTHLTPLWLIKHLKVVPLIIIPKLGCWNRSERQICIICSSNIGGILCHFCFCHFFNICGLRLKVISWSSLLSSSFHELLGISSNKATVHHSEQDSYLVWHFPITL